MYPGLQPASPGRLCQSPYWPSQNSSGQRGTGSCMPSKAMSCSGRGSSRLTVSPAAAEILAGYIRQQWPLAAGAGPAGGAVFLQGRLQLIPQRVMCSRRAPDHAFTVLVAGHDAADAPAGQQGILLDDTAGIQRIGAAAGIEQEDVNVLSKTGSAGMQAAQYEPSPQMRSSRLPASAPRAARAAHSRSYCVCP